MGSGSKLHVFSSQLGQFRVSQSGLHRDLQQQLQREGYNIRIYVPFGEAWYPYLMRRLAERPANLLFIVNSVLRESPLRFLYRNSK